MLPSSLERRQPKYTVIRETVWLWKSWEHGMKSVMYHVVINNGKKGLQYGKINDQTNQREYQRING